METDRRSMGGDRRTSVLVVDDDDTLRAVAARVLRRGGLFVVEAADANAAVDALRAGNIDLVLSDVHMPGRDGFEMAVEMRSLRPELVVVFMSGQHGHGEERCVEAGATFVEKPFTPATLRQAVNSALGRT